MRVVDICGKSMVMARIDDSIADDTRVGILAMDDLLGVFADALGQFKGLIAHEFEAEQRARR